MRAEGQGDADDSGGGQDWGDLDANGAESRQQGDDDNDGNADIREQSADGRRALILPVESRTCRFGEDTAGAPGHGGLALLRARHHEANRPVDAFA